MRFFKLLLLFTLFFTLFSCSRQKKDNSNRANFVKKGVHYKLYYIDNGGNCANCLQAKQAAKRVAKQLSHHFDKSSFKIVRTYKQEEKEMRVECKLFARQIMVAKFKGNKQTSFKKFSTDELAFYQDNPQIVIDKISLEIEQFIKNRGKK